MSEWWEALEPMLKVLYCIAIPSTLLLAIQTVQIIFGFGEGGEGFNPTDTSGLDLHNVDLGDVGDMTGAANVDMAHDASSSDFGDLRLFTLQGFVALLTVFSWTSISFVKSGMNLGLSLGIGVVLGAIAMYLVARVVLLSKKMVASGNVDIKNALGKTGKVYIPIAGSGVGAGKITITLQERFLEFDAITDGGELIPVGSFVRVVDVRDGVLVVERGEE